MKSEGTDTQNTPRGMISRIFYHTDTDLFSSSWKNKNTLRAKALEKALQMYAGQHGSAAVSENVFSNHISLKE